MQLLSIPIYPCKQKVRVILAKYHSLDDEWEDSQVIPIVPQNKQSKKQNTPMLIVKSDIMHRRHFQGKQIERSIDYHIVLVNRNNVLYFMNVDDTYEFNVVVEEIPLSILNMQKSHEKMSDSSLSSTNNDTESDENSSSDESCASKNIYYSHGGKPLNEHGIRMHELLEQAESDNDDDDDIFGDMQIQAEEDELLIGKKRTARQAGLVTISTKKILKL